MAQRVFGPVLGAGTQIIELEGQKQIQAGALGFVGYAGVFEKGPIGEMNILLSGQQFAKKMGSRIDDSTAADAAEDFFETAAGAGGMLAVRVTDGNERSADGFRTFDQTQTIANVYTREIPRRTVGRVKGKNGGRWAGKKANYTNLFSIAGDLTEITLDTGLSVFSTDQWKGGYIELDAVANSRYPVVGNTAAGVITIKSDQEMATDLANSGSPTNFRYYLVLENEAKAVSVRFGDGDELPDSEFSMSVFVDGAFVKKYTDLNTDPTSPKYWVDVINDDGANDEVEIEDLFLGSHVASVRPVNHYGINASITSTVLTAKVDEFAIIDVTGGGGDPTFAIGTTNDSMLPQTITITMTAATTGTAVSDRFGALGTVTLGTLFDPPAAAGGALTNKWVPPFTVTAGGTPLAATDQLTIVYKPFAKDELINGLIYPDKSAAANKRTSFRITDNDHKSITIASGSDLTLAGALTGGEEFLVEQDLELCAGRDGNADVSDAEYINQAWDSDSSPFNRIVGKNLGLIKFGTPGVTSVSVQKAGKNYAELKNHQYRYEIPAATVTEAGADEYVNETLGRSDYAVVSFPSYGSKIDPDGQQGKLKQVPLTGMIHGREARITNDFLGYHKAGAGLDATLPALLKIPTGDVILNEEFLNPRGINVVKKKSGNFILWGDRTLHLDPQWRFKHERETMSFYEQVLAENFDFIIFALNSPETRDIVRTTLQAFFQIEYAKNALDNDFAFEDAASIKIDAENNTPLTKSQGDLFAEILLRLTGTVERLRIKIGKQGIFES